jgi:hypothetical protein
VIVRDIRVDDQGDKAALAAEVAFDSGAAPFSLRYELSGGEAGSLVEHGDAFVAATLPVAMAAREDLAIDAPVSSRLLENIAPITALYRLWGPMWRMDLRPCKVSAAQRRPAGRREGVGLFLSGGVDSFHSLLTHTASDAIDPGRRPSHLLFVHGLDIALDNRELFESAHETVRRAASETGTTPLVVTTNLRELSERFVHWELYHGAALASVGLALSGVVGRCLIPSSFGFSTARPWGSHPQLDPLWSTEDVEVLHDGGESSRARKLHTTVAKSELALEQLRVCYRQLEGAYNCGRCEKCVLTMIGLEAAGALQNCRTLPSKVHPEDVRRLNLASPGSWATGRNLLVEMDELGYDGPLRKSLAARLRRSEVEIVLRLLLRRLVRRYRYPPRPRGSLLRRYPGLP